MYKSIIAFAAILSAGTIGCASKPIPVPLAPGSDASALVGEWTGEYTSHEAQRSGSIEFSLRAGADTAYGSVIMVPRPTVDPSVRPDQIQALPMKGSPSQVLTIRFVRVEGNQVMGRLDPYKDPDCGCQLTTTFRGTFKDANTIEGTFDSQGNGFDRVSSSGKWKVSRN